MAKPKVNMRVWEAIQMLEEIEDQSREVTVTFGPVKGSKDRVVPAHDVRFAPDLLCRKDTMYTLKEASLASKH